MKGLGLHDLNNDGYLDLYLSNAVKRLCPSPDGRVRPRGGHSTLVNRGNGGFEAVDFGIDSAGYKRTAVFGDLDRDGLIDAYVSNSAYYGDAWLGFGEPNALYMGTAAGGYTESRLEAMVSADPNFWVGDDGRTQKNFKGTVIRDFDGDGLPDIVTSSLSDLWAKSKYDLTTEADPGYQGRWSRGVYVFHNQSTLVVPCGCKR